MREKTGSVVPLGLAQMLERLSTEEKREFVQLLIEKVVLNAGEKKALVHIRRFPAAAALPGMLLLVLVAGVGFEPTTFGL